MDFQTSALDLDLNKGRSKRGQWSRQERPKNIFSGASKLQVASIADVPVSRLIVLPGNTASTAGYDLKHVFTSAYDLSWKASAEILCPFSLQWQQSMPARFEVYFHLPDDVICAGLGERFSGLNLRGKKHTLCTTVDSKHNESSDALYVSIPFLILAQGSQFTGVLLDSAAPQRWDLDSELINEAKIELFSRQPWQLYVFGPTSLPELVGAYTTLTGRSQLPPRWALGHQQSRWSYPDEHTVQELAKEFRNRKIPCDTIVLDIDYTDDYRVFTCSKDRFPHFEQMNRDLDQQGFKIITIVDPGVKEDPQYNIFIEGCAQGVFCKKSDGELFTEKVWSGDSVFPDFMQEKTRKWWGEHLKFFTDNGVAGIWNDLNEPEFFVKKDVLPNNMTELPDENDQLFLQHCEHSPVGHLEVRNLYGLLMCKATYEALLKLRPNQRPFILTRSGGAGIQRYSAIWLGDNTSWFNHLAMSIPILINMGLSGVPFVGADVGGFLGDATPELLIRWYETGIFYPFFRNHCWLEGRAQEPFAYSEKVEKKIRKLIETRYQLLPYIQNLFWEHKRSGAPLIRPLMWHYPDDVTAREIDDQFLFGKDILVAPITERGRRHRVVYLPEGNWYPFSGADSFQKNGNASSVNVLSGGQTHIIEFPLGSVPAFIREGSIIPMVDVIQSTADYDRAKITFNVFGTQASSIFFEDDGNSFAYENGTYNEWQITFKSGHLNATAVHKGYTIPHCEYYMAHKGKLEKIDL